STPPAQRRDPTATATAARNVRATPTTVTWLGVSGVRPSAVIRASAWRRTQASNRVVNTCHLHLSRGLGGKLPARLVIDLDDLSRDCLPRVPARLLHPIVAEPVAQLAVARQDDQRSRELTPVLRRHGDAVPS